MPPSSHPPQSTPSQHALLLNIARRADLFLSPDHQPYATIPLSGNTVPLYSPIFRTWLSQAFEERGFLPTPAQTGAVLRKLDEDAHGYPIIHPVHIRTALNAPHTYRLDLANPASQAIEINGKQWTTVDNLDCRFRRPQSSIQFAKPEETSAPLYKFIERAFHLKTDDAHALSTWLVAAMLPDLTPPILVITGEARDEAVRKLRTILDPVTNPILPMPTSESQFGRQALTNNVLAYAIHKHLSEKRKGILNKLRTGLSVVLKDVSKCREEISTSIHRPIIISAAEAIEISASQLNLEINNTSQTVLEQIFAALLDAVVRGIHVMSSRTIEEPFTAQDLSQAPSQQMPRTPAPYS